MAWFSGTHVGQPWSLVDITSFALGQVDFVGTAGRDGTGRHGFGPQRMRRAGPAQESNYPSRLNDEFPAAAQLNVAVHHNQAFPQPDPGGAAICHL
jgi:hypothetical protein